MMWFGYDCLAKCRAAIIHKTYIFYSTLEISGVSAMTMAATILTTDLTVMTVVYRAICQQSLVLD